MQNRQAQIEDMKAQIAILESEENEINDLHYQLEMVEAGEAGEALMNESTTTQTEEEEMDIVEEEVAFKQVTLKSGEVFTIRKVNRELLRKLWLGVGNFDLIQSGESFLESLPAGQIENVANAADRLLDYCLGTAVVDEPPSNLNFDSISFILDRHVRERLHVPEVRRAYWLRFLYHGDRGLSQEDQKQLLLEVLIFIFGKKEVAKNSKKQNPAPNGFRSVTKRNRALSRNAARRREYTSD